MKQMAVDKARKKWGGTPTALSFTGRAPASCSYTVRALLAVIVSAALMAFAGCSSLRAAGNVSETRLLFDTVCTITIYDPPDDKLLHQSFELCEKYDSLFSRTKEGSDIWRINNSGGEPVVVDRQTAELIRSGIYFGDFSDGAFDISVGMLSNLWNFGGDTSVPSAEDIAAAVKTIGYSQIIITDGSKGGTTVGAAMGGTTVAEIGGTTAGSTDGTTGSATGATVRLTRDGAMLDLGGIAKGYIADRVADFLKDNGAKSAVIDLGGNIVLVGKKTSGKQWRVGVRRPAGDGAELLGAVVTGEASVVTSGIYERNFEKDGVVYHHILDPVTGYPAVSDVVSATVVTKDSAVGDALSTIVILSGSKKAVEYLDKTPGLYGAVLLLDSGELLQYGDVEFE